MLSRYLAFKIIEVSIYIASNYVLTPYVIPHDNTPPMILFPCISKDVLITSLLWLYTIIFRVYYQ